MESGFLTFIFVLSFALFSSQFGIPDWDDVLVARKGMPTTLVCTDEIARGAVAVNWLAKPTGARDYKLVLSANERKEFSGGASKASMRLTDPNFQNSGNFSLFILPQMEDSGYYSCLIKQHEKKLKERIILLAILTVTVAPAAPILQQSTLRLTASVNPSFAITKITWEAPGGSTMKSESTNKDTVAKLTKMQSSDGGAYVCVVHPLGSSSSSLYRFSVDVTVADKVIPPNNVTYPPPVRTATQNGTPLQLTCPVVRGDYVDVHWQPPDSKRNNMKLVHHYDRWRGNIMMTEKRDRLKPAGPPYNADTGSFSFLLTPALSDGGQYFCNVFLDDHVTSQRTLLSVLKVTTRSSSTGLELVCRYNELSNVRRAKWKHQNESRQLTMSSKLGSISVFLPLPITSDTAGNYTCVLELKSGQTVSAKHEVKPPFIGGKNESVSVTTPSLLPSLSALLLLVPLVAAAVGVLLWRQKHISNRGIEQSLSVYSGEVENVYENPEDIRQAPPQGSVYMDLKPRGEDDVYKELERFEQCQG